MINLFSPIDVERTLIKVNNEVIDPSQVIYLEGSGNYTFIHFENRPKIILAITLSKMTAQLPCMLRIHKSYSINVGKINRTRRSKKGKGVLMITLHDGTQISVSRRRSNEIVDALTPYRLAKRNQNKRKD